MDVRFAFPGIPVYSQHNSNILGRWYQSSDGKWFFASTKETRQYSTPSTEELNRLFNRHLDMLQKQIDALTARGF